MNEQRLALILSVQAEIDGMKAEDAMREQQGNSVIYAMDSFMECAERMKYYASLNDEHVKEVLAHG